MRLFTLLHILLFVFQFICRAQLAEKSWFLQAYTAANGLIDTRDGFLQRDRWGFLWIGARQGLSRFDGRTFTAFTTLDGLQENCITDLKSDKAGYMYVATPSAIHRYTGGQPAFYRYPTTLLSRCGAICPEDSSRIWVGCSGADTLYRWEKGRPVTLPVNGFVTCLEQDQQGYVYALTNRQYLYIIKDTQVQQCLYLPFVNHRLARPMHKDEAGSVWCTGNTYVYRLKGTGIADSLPLGPRGGGLQKGRLYMRGNQLARLQNGQWKPVVQVPEGDVTDMEEDKGGNYWLLTQDALLRVYPRVYERINQRAASHHFPAVYAGQQQYLPATRDDSAAALFHPEKLRAISYLPALGNRPITGLARDAEKNLWVSTDQGALYKIVADGKGRFCVASQLAIAVNGEAGIPLAFTFDGNGNLWVLTRFRLHLFWRLPDGRFSEGHQLVLGEEQRISELTAGRCSLLPGDQHRIYLRTDSLLYLFDGRQLLQRYNRAAPRLACTGIILHASAPSPASRLTTNPLGMPGHLRLPYGQHTISFTYTGFSPTDPAAVVYRYKLLGYDSSWQAITRLEKATYTRLTAGDYTFVVQAANGSGLWSEPVRYSFSIAPAWYATATAQVGWVVLITVFLLLAGYYILKIREQKKELEKIVIEQQLKTLRAQINPHFLQNTFEFLAQSIRLGVVETSITIIHKIAGYFRHILYKSDESIVTLEDELESAEEYLSLKRMMLHNAFDYTIHTGDEVDTIGIRIPSLLLQPLIENAVKYGIDTYAKTGSIRIAIQQDEQFALITISDTGSAGRSSLLKKEGYIPKGVEITRTRLQLLFHQYKLKPAVILTSSPEGGTTVLIKIPLF